MKSLAFLAAALVLVTLAGTTAAQKKLVCYYSSWAVYRPGNGKFDVENLDANLCTHAIYAFIGLNADASIKILDSWNDINLRGFQRFNNLKLKNPNLKTLIAIGGWNEGSTVFSAVMGNAGRRALFVNNVYNFVKKYGFNGLDLDWEYPAQRGGSSADKANFVYLMRELRAKFAPQGLLVTAAVGVTSWSISTSYSVPDLAANLDFINLMTYDFHGSWDSRTGQNSPLYASSVDGDKSLNVDSAVQNWIRQGAPASKLVLGVATYGRSFTLQSTTNTGLGAPTTGGGAPGPYTRETGMLGYNEICERQSGWTIKYDTQQQVPYAYKSNQWVGYDNMQSIAVKGAYVRNKGLGGAMVWAVEMDDFRGVCGTGAFPLINKLKSSI